MGLLYNCQQCGLEGSCLDGCGITILGLITMILVIGLCLALPVYIVSKFVDRNKKK